MTRLPPCPLQAGNEYVRETNTILCLAIAAGLRSLPPSSFDSGAADCPAAELLREKAGFQLDWQKFVTRLRSMTLDSSRPGAERAISVRIVCNGQSFLVSGEEDDSITIREG